MTDPSRREIEDGTARRQDLTIETGYRGDRRRVDVSSLRCLGTGRNIEPLTFRQGCGPRNERHIPLSSTPLRRGGVPCRQSIAYGACFFVVLHFDGAPTSANPSRPARVASAADRDREPRQDASPARGK